MASTPILKTMESLTPQAILALLDNHIIGQKEAKKSVAIALRSRYRRMLLSEELKDEISPKNILLIGPTGVGKTEIARRLAKIINAPFVKVEATRFTEVGYVGRDVESMVRDLVSMSYNMIKQEHEKNNTPRILEMVEERILSALLPGAKDRTEHDSDAKEAWLQMKYKLENKELEEQEIQIKIKKPSAHSSPVVGFLSNMGQDDMESQMNNIFDQFSDNKKDRLLKIKEARPLLFEEEASNFINNENIKSEAIARAENLGIIFLDEMDKIANQGSNQKGAEVSREGVQRDLLPIVEGTRVQTKYGAIKTDYILFIGAGAFHFSKPSDLIPELQGRFPIRVQLNPLSEHELYQILVEPKHSLSFQYKKLLETENVHIEITDDAIKHIAEYAFKANDKIENIGARRLHTVLEKVMEELSFNASNHKGKNIIIDKEYVMTQLEDVSLEQNLSQYIL